MNNKINIFRISYRLKNGNLPLIGEIIIKSRKSQEEINFAEAIEKYWSKTTQQIKLDEILLIDKIGEE